MRNVAGTHRPTPYFHGVTRFTTSAFMRAELAALESRGVAPHI